VKDLAREQAEVLSDGLQEIGYSVVLSGATPRGYIRGASIEVLGPRGKVVASIIINHDGKIIIEKEAETGLVSRLLGKLGLRSTDVEIDEVLPVLFRVWNRDPHSVIALFPTVASDADGHFVESYEHIGQHGGANLVGVMAASRPAQEAEYKTLKAELERLGYNLKVYQRSAPWMRQRLLDYVRGTRRT
jgi:hypothetical protein